MNALTHIMAKSGLLTKDLDYHLVRASMALIFLASRRTAGTWQRDFRRSDEGCRSFVRFDRLANRMSCDGLKPIRTRGLNRPKPGNLRVAPSRRTTQTVSEHATL
jgi:hypothetical protein